MDWASILMLCGMVGGGAWLLSPMKTAIEQLTEAIKELRAEIGEEHDRGSDHERRLVVLETSKE